MDGEVETKGFLPVLLKISAQTGTACWQRQRFDVKCVNSDNSCPWDEKGSVLRRHSLPLVQVLVLLFLAWHAPLCLCMIEIG